jgi:hypothetical protein
MGALVGRGVEVGWGMLVSVGGTAVSVGTTSGTSVALGSMISAVGWTSVGGVISGSQPEKTSKLIRSKVIVFIVVSLLTGLEDLSCGKLPLDNRPLISDQLKYKVLSGSVSR